jgi:general secretion pathway protein A
MYTEYFGLKELPFSIAPDPRYLYLSSHHREALAHLIYGVNSDGGFVLLTGEVGTGKTTVCRCLLEQLPENTNVAFIINPKLTVDELLASICDELGVRYPEGNKSIKVFVDHINEYLLDNYARGHKTVIIIEEAQNLSTEVLEQIRLLTNLETTRSKLLQIIMLGQPELRDILSRPELRQISQRITARYHIGPLTRREIGSYVNHRLTVAGAKEKLFPDSLFKRLYGYSRGIPRLINVICDRALIGTYVQGKKYVDKSTFKKAAREVFGDTVSNIQKKKTFRWTFAILLLIISAIALVFSFFRYREDFVITRQPDIPLAAVNALDKTGQNPFTWIIDNETVEKSKDTAYQTLFSQWNIQYQQQDQSTLCEFARNKGLFCLTPDGVVGAEKR